MNLDITSLPPVTVLERAHTGSRQPYLLLLSFRMFLEEDVTIKYWIFLFFFPKIVLAQIWFLSVVQQ